MAARGSNAGQSVLKAKCAIDSGKTNNFFLCSFFLKCGEEAQGQLKREQTEHEAPRFPAGEGVMPPVVWGLLFFPISYMLPSQVCWDSTREVKAPGRKTC